MFKTQKRSVPPALSEKSREQKVSAAETKKVRSKLTEDQIDKMLKDSFPASDPPGLY